MDSVYEKESFGSMKTKEIDSDEFRAPLQREDLNINLKAVRTMELVTA